MGSVDRRRLSKLEGLASPGPPRDERLERRRSEIIAELERFEARIRGMSPEEHEAWRESPEVQAEIRALEAELRDREEA